MGIGTPDGAPGAHFLGAIKGTGAGPMGRVMRHGVRICMYLRARTVPVISKLSARANHSHRGRGAGRARDASAEIVREFAVPKTFGLTVASSHVH